MALGSLRPSWGLHRSAGERTKDWHLAERDTVVEAQGWAYRTHTLGNGLCLWSLGAPPSLRTVEVYSLFRNTVHIWRCRGEPWDSRFRKPPHLQGFRRILEDACSTVREEQGRARGLTFPPVLWRQDDSGVRLVVAPQLCGCQGWITAQKREGSRASRSGLALPPTLPGSEPFSFSAHS